MKNEANAVPFLPIVEAAKVTGLSQFYLRTGCKNGTVPHIKAGKKYFIDVERLLQTLRAEGA